MLSFLSLSLSLMSEAIITNSLEYNKPSKNQILIIEFELSFEK